MDKTVSRMKRLVLGIVLTGIVLVVGGPFVYFHFIEGKAPPKLSLRTTPVPSSATHGARKPLAAMWKITNGSLARYRVTEILFGQSNTAVGTATSIRGSATIAGTMVTRATFTVDMTSFHSNQALRDRQFQGRIMDTAQFPTSTFALRKPIPLAPVPADGVIRHYSATGTLALHGVTRAITIPLTARRTGNVITVQGDAPIRFSDYGIDNPTGGPARVGNDGELEFVLDLS